MKEWLNNLKGHFNSMPGPLKGVVGLLAAGGLFAAGSATGLTSWQFLLILLLLLLVVLGTYWLVRWIIRRTQSRRLERGIMEIGVAPGTLNDPASLAKLDEVKRKFQKGIDEYRRAGSDIYVLPWYLIIGESGSGKTQAILHSDLPAPPGMEHEYQGTGGTIGMDWFFKLYAVLLDTAGSLVFEKVRPGETGAWAEFLGLLKKHRPRCPANGLLLFIPADSLIKDPPEAMVQKAQQLARQLHLIQRELDVCFPIYVIVSKSDLISGFREFFQHLKDPLDHQILGWSNPERIEKTLVRKKDAADAEEQEKKLRESMTEAFESMVRQLKQHRLGFLRDPAPANPQGRRTDETDTLYGFPRNLQKLEEPLWNYLRHIFAYGPFSRPLFFRGIYFNSSMQEGAALDEQLARALRLPVGALPGGGAFKQDRSLFLPDLFREKVFGETGLVVRATSTLRLLRAWQVAFYCCAFAAVVFWLVLAAVGMHSFRESVGDQRDYWNLARNSWESPFTNSPIQVWQPIVDPVTRKYRGDSRDLKPPLKAEGTTFNLIEFHAQLRNQAQTNIHVRWVFKPLEWLIRPDLDRLRAQRIAFEGSIIRPLLLLSQAKMGAAFDPRIQQEALTPDELVRQQRALESLLRYEAEAFDRRSGAQRRLAQQETLKKGYLQPWLNYVLDTDLKDTNLASLAFTMERTYSGPAGRLDAWPPQALSQGFSLNENRAISNGLVRLKLHLEAKLATADDLKKIEPLIKYLQDYKLAEMQYATDLSRSQPAENRYSALEQKAQALQAALDEARRPGGLLAANPYSLADAYAGLQQKADKTYKETFGGIRALTTLPSERRGKAFPLYVEVAEFLTNVVNAYVLRPFEDASRTAYDLRELDRVYLAAAGQTTQRLFQVRWDTYSTSHKLMNKFPLVFTDNPNSLTEPEVQKAGRVLGSATADPTASGNVPPEHARFLEPFQRKLQALQPVLQALLTTNNEIETCQIIVWTNNVRKDWRGIKLTAARPNPKVHYIDRHEVLGSLKLSEPFELKAFRTADEAEPLVYTLVPKDKDWAVLRWLREAHAKPESPGRTNWIIDMYPPGPEGKPSSRPLSFKLEFHAPLPDLDRWPKALGTAP